jgi:WD40 repeat protein
MLRLQGHREGMRVYDLSFSADGMKLASTGEDGSVLLWDFVTGMHALISQHGRFQVRSVSMSPDGSWLAWGLPRSVQVRDLHGAATASLGERDADTWARACFSPDGKTLATGDARAVSLWATGAWSSPRAVVTDCGETTGGLAFSPDGRFLATTHRLPGPQTSRVLYRIRLRDPNTGETIREIDRPTQGVTSLSFSPDGSLLACTYGSTWAVFRVPDGQQVKATKHHHREFFALAFTPDGRHLVLSLSDLSVRFLDTTSWGQRKSFKWKIGRVGCLTLSPDGMKAAGGSNKGLIIVWDVDL